MHLLAPFLLLLPAALCEKLVIPQVEAAVDQEQKLFSAYEAYTEGPTGTLKAAAAKVTPKVLAQVVNNQAKAAKVAAADTPYWYAQITHQGRSAFNTDTSYKVYRNVVDYGAYGDGVHDDTVAIQKAMDDGNRCKPGSCASSTITPAVIYFPAGTYLISSSIIMDYYTIMLGNPNNRPILKATAGFSGLGLIDGDPYVPGNPNGVLQFGSTNVFFRQIRNFVVDMTSIPSGSAATGIHWPTAQATSIQNVQINMSTASGTQHQGLYIESGSGGFMTDLVFNGGLYGAVLGNQQFTMRNMVFNNCQTGIKQIWNWGWTYKSITFNNCKLGLDMTNGGSSNQAVGSVVFIDSTITNTPVGIKIARNYPSSKPNTGGTLTMENVAVNNCPVAVQGPSGQTYYAGSTGSTTLQPWKTGTLYNPTAQGAKQLGWASPARPASLLSGSKYYERSKNQYQNQALTSIVSARSSGAKGDGVTDDTAALQAAITTAAAAGSLMFIDAGTYKVTSTIVIPKGSKVVGECYSVIMGSGSYFNDINNNQVVVKVGNIGDVGVVEWSDMIVSTQGPAAGAVLIKWNINSPSGTPSAMWDVHARVGGAAGTQQQVAQCPTTPSSSAVNPNCIAAYMSIWLSTSSSNIYFENVWAWVADHDIEDPNLTQITLYGGRGIYVAGGGTFWFVGTASEHHTLYQYQLSNTKNIFMGQIQTETPYYQPNPQAPTPFPVNTALNDPNFSTLCPSGSPATCKMAWGLRITNSNNIFVWGSGLYSFFNNYDTSCNAQANGAKCQTAIFQYDSASSAIYMHNLNTVGSVSMVQRDTTSLAKNSDNYNNFPSTINLFRSS